MTTALLLAGQYLLVGRLVLLPVLTPLAAAWTFYAAAGLAEYLRERRAAPSSDGAVLALHQSARVAAAGRPAASRPARRDVTLLFSDIRGFTTLSETRSPEEVVALLNRYFRACRSTWCATTAARSTSSSATASWRCGARRSTTPTTRRSAVACALDMADTLAGVQARAGRRAPDFDVGIGLHSGPAVVGLIGLGEAALEYTAIGDTVNLASRIEGLTKDAQRRILVSRETMQLCGGAFDFVSCGTFPVKGRAQPVELFEPRRKT